MAAFWLFFVQSESSLAHRRRMERGRNTSNCKTLFGIEKIPSDNHIRDLLDPVPPELLEPCFEHAWGQMRQHCGMKDFERLDGRLLIALDGSEYFCSEKRGCTRCLTRKRSNGKTENYHTLLAGNFGGSRAQPRVAADARAAGRCREAGLRTQRSQTLVGKARRTNALDAACLSGRCAVQFAPHVRGGSGSGWRLLVCMHKEDSHKTLYEYLRGIEPQQRRMSERRMGGRTRNYIYRWVENLPLRDGKDALHAHWLGVEVVDQSGKPGSPRTGLCPWGGRRPTAAPS
jgi:hypothetical protein